jgi:YggT family protein
MRSASKVRATKALKYAEIQREPVILRFLMAQAIICDRRSSVFLQIVNLILDVATGLVGGACLMRLVMQWQRLPFQNPIGRFVFAVTDWMVMPLRRFLPAIGRLDTASLVAAWLMKLSHVTAMWVLTGTQAAFLGILVASLFGVLHWLVSGLSVIILLYAVLSWVQPNSGSMMLLSRLVEPWLAPIRNALPQPGGIDLSPLVLLVILQIAGMLLAGLQHGGF